MEIIDIDASMIENYLKSDGGVNWDFYRRFCNNGNNIIGLYYKDYIDLRDRNQENIKKYINTLKRIWNNVDEWTWEHHLVYKLFAKINRINETQKSVPCKLGVPIISGIALCENYPVGVLVPWEILNYKSLIELKNEGVSLSDEEKELIFSVVESWVNSLIDHDIYPSLYLGNILVNPNDYSDVILDGLDGPSVCRIESKKYVDTLAKRGLDLKKHAINELNSLKDEFFEKENPRAL